nr:two-component regulator propeller domain-containing protein [uncultured Carboxylicivirga sp.]
MNKLFLSIVFVLAFALPSMGQKDLRVEYLNIDDGLPQNTVQSITKDPFGFMWFGTDNGLCRYDGYSFEYYYSNGSEDHLWHNRIIQLISDRNSSLFVISQKGLQVFDLLTGNFLSIKNPEIQLIFKQDVVNAEYDNGVLWVVTRTNGVYKLKYNDNRFSVEEHYWTEDNLPVPICIYKGVNNQIYLGTTGQLYQYDTKSNSFIAFKDCYDFSPTYIQTICDDTDHLYIGTNNGMFLNNKKSNELIWFNYDSQNKASLSHSSVTSIVKTSDNEVLIGTLGGFCTLDTDNNSIRRIKLFNKQDESNQVEFIRSLFTDNQGTVWVGTDKIGLAYYNIHQKNFFSINESNSELMNLNRNIINSILKSDDYLWVGTAGNGLARINQSKNEYRIYRNDMPQSVKSNFITSIIEDDSKNTWVGTWGMGIQVFRNGNLIKSFNTEDGLAGDFISYIYITKSGDKIICTQQGLSIYNESLEKFYAIGPIGNFSKWEAGCMLEDKYGFFWIGTINGLHRFNGRLVKKTENTVISHYEQVVFEGTDQQNSLPNNYITTINDDQDGNVWIGTYGGGIAKCVPTSNGNYEFINYTQADGLANNVVYSILCDDSNNLWITTENGLSKYVIENNQFVNYYKQDGLRNNQYYWSAACKDNDGKIYVGGLNGLNYFHPDSILSYSYQTKALITTLNISNHQVSAGDVYHNEVPLKRESFANDTITLSYKDNVFSLEFSALDFLHSSKIKYAYKLEGVDKDWIEVDSKRRIASYTNLSGGIYPFQLKSTNQEGIWNEDLTQVFIEIVPPFWQEMWFKLLMIAFVIALVATYSRYRSFRITMQKKRLEQLVRQRTIEINEKNKQLEENSQRLLDNNEQLERRRSKIEKQKTQLEDQNKEIISQRDQLISLNEEIESIHQMRMQFFTNISHEFRTPLTLILSPIERILNQIDDTLPQSVRNSIHIMKRNAERLLLLTNQILTFRKIEAGKLQVLLHEGKLDEVVSDIAEAFKVLSEDKNISYSITIEKADYSGWYDKSKIENILFNLLANAFKYTPNEGSVECTLRLIEHNNHKNIEVVVTDSGQGIKPDVVERVFDRFYRADSNLGFGTGIGLSLVKELVVKLCGEISVSSEYGKGSAFKVILPIELEAFTDYTIVEEEISDTLSMNEKVELMKDSHDVIADPETNDKEKNRLLIVEDNDDLRNFLSESLSDSYMVYSAKDGQEGYEKAIQHEIDMVVSDIMMPRLNGLDLCKQLKNNLNTSHLPVILLSAKGMEENQVEGLGVGADDYITKPFNFALLQAKIKSLIDNRQKLKKIYLQNNTEEVELQGGSLDDDFMQKVNNVVSELYADPTFDIETFSSKMFVSRSLLYKKLKALTNVSPNEYINVFRLKKALPLLKSKKYQVGEVAVMVGFNDPKYFSRVFKKFYNCSPSEYAGA